MSVERIVYPSGQVRFHARGRKKDGGFYRRSFVSKRAAEVFDQGRGKQLETLVELVTSDQFAALADIKPASVRVYRQRGTIPEPDGMIGRTAYWKLETVEKWLASRRKGAGRPHKLVAPTSEEAGA